MVRVLVISPYPTVRAGLRSLLESEAGVEVVREAEGVPELPASPPLRPDVALVDDASGLSVLALLEERAPEMGIVLLGSAPRYGEPWTATARGYLTRDAGAEDILPTVRAVSQGLTVIHPAFAQQLLGGVSVRSAPGVAGRDTLTARELEVLQLLASGLPNKTIAVRLGRSQQTAKFHVSSLLAKRGASSRTEALTTAAHRGLLIL